MKSIITPNYMYLPVELQKHILSFLNPNAEYFIRNKGRCIARTRKEKHPRCLRKVDFTETLTCYIHQTLGDIFSSRGCRDRTYYYSYYNRYKVPLPPYCISSDSH